MQSFGLFRLHYELKDGSHEMDAFVRHRCEADLLATIKEVSEFIGVPVGVNSRAYGKGSLQEFLTFVGQNSDSLKMLGCLCAGVFAAVQWGLTASPKRKMANLEVEEKKVAIEKASLELEKLRQALRKENTSGPKPSSGPKNGLAFEDRDVVASLLLMPKILIRRSDFYKTLLKYDKVTAIAFAVDHGIDLSQKYFVPRSKFSEFVFDSNELDSEIVEDAVIEIVAPVLRPGSYHWRGLYEGKSISFAMEDVAFKEGVLKREIKFQYGSFITCVLEINRKINEGGEVVCSGYAVKTVLSKTDGGAAIETHQGKKYKSEKIHAAHAKQGSLFE